MESNVPPYATKNPRQREKQGYFDFKTIVLCALEGVRYNLI